MAGMRWIIPALVVGLLSLAGCGTTTARDSQLTDGGPIGTGKGADYGFSGATLSGTAFKGSSLEGEPAVLWFWAPWCPTLDRQESHVGHARPLILHFA
jgi:thiol-disulfide isomerase/thioredoxin